MLKVEFKNAVVKDDGYGLEVNGKELSAIISTALGTKVGDKRAGYGSDLPAFKSNSCNLTVIIDPNPTEVKIETDQNIWHSTEDMEEERQDELKAENAEADPEE